MSAVFTFKACSAALAARSSAVAHPLSVTSAEHVKSNDVMNAFMQNFKMSGNPSGESDEIVVQIVPHAVAEVQHVAEVVEIVDNPTAVFIDQINPGGNIVVVSTDHK